MAGSIVIDGLPVSLADEAAVRAVIIKKDQAIADGAAALADANAKIGALTGEKAVLEKQLADAKAEASPAALDKRVADRAKLIADAKKVVPGIVTDAVSDADIRKAVVAAKLGSAADAMDANAIDGAYIALLAGCADAKVENIAPAAKFGDAAASIATLRAARYA